MNQGIERICRGGAALLAAVAIGAGATGCSSSNSSSGTSTSAATNAAVPPKTVEVAAMPGTLPIAGGMAPEFRLTSNEGVDVALADLRGRWVVLYFYPKNFTGGCTVEAQNFQRDIERFEALDAAVVGVSVDSVASHKEFCTKEGLTFRLLSDTDGAVSKRYGSLNERGGRRMSARNTFVIDPEGRVAKVFTGVDPNEHSAEVLAALEGLRAK